MIENMEKEEKTVRKEETIDMMDALDEICEDYRKAGIEEGKEAGMEAGRKQFGDLILCLLSENCADDIERVSRDSEYRERLLVKYKIIG